MSIQKCPELKRVTGASTEEKPRYDWKCLVENHGEWNCEYRKIGEIAYEIVEVLMANWIFF
jgi:hypothetical protein